MITRRMLQFGIVFLQVFDIVIHVATNQVEPIRIVSNIIIIMWLGISELRILSEWSKQLAGSAITLYTALNLVFLAQNGVINNETNEFRAMLFILVGSTIGLSMIIAYIQQKEKQQ